MKGVVPIPPDFAARYRAAGHWTDRPLIEAYETAFTQHADDLAVVAGDDQFTFRRVGEQAMRVARHLLDLGYGPGDVVVVQLPNIPEFIVLYLALQHLGCVPLMALPPHREHEIGSYLAVTEARAYAIASGWGSFDFQRFADDLTEQHGHVQHVLVAGENVDPRFVSINGLLATTPRATEADVRAVTARIDPDEPCTFQLSGGTTGVPKVIPRTHNDYRYNTVAIAAHNAIDDDARLLVCLPIAHNFPLACPGIAGFFFAGRPVVLSTSTNPADLVALIDRHRITHLELVPALVIRCLDDPALAHADLSSVRVINTGGQKFQTETKHRTEAAFPRAKVQEVFGMAEGQLFISRLDDPDDARWETVGRPVGPDDEVLLVDDDGRRVPPGQMGELLCRGPYTIRGYLSADEHNARTFTPDGFYRTGDVMRRRPDGNYVVEGRMKDLINRGGEKISAEEVEDLALGHPAIRNIAAVAMPDDVLGERMCAFVILQPGASLDLDELGRFLTEHGVARFKHPERLELVDEFPLSPVGKVQKKQLAARLAVEAAARPRPSPASRA
ncbi:MAG: AMP-binding protein [Ilumatobacteraceae bacterium]